MHRHDSYSRKWAFPDFYFYTLSKQPTAVLFLFYWTVLQQSTVLDVKKITFGTLNNHQTLTFLMSWAFDGTL